MKKILIIALVIVLIGCAVGGFFIYRHYTSYISKDAALKIAMDDAGLTMPQLKDYEIDFERTRYSAWYEVDLDTHGMDYDYNIDAVNGSILSSNSKVDD